MSKNPELAARLREIYTYLDENSLTMNNDWYTAMGNLKRIITELDPPEFPPAIDGISIGRVSYIPGCEPANAAEERRFAVSKTVPCEPHEAYDMRTKEKKIYTTNTYVLGFLEWDNHEEAFDFKSVGTRWLEAAPSKEVCDMILAFCKQKSDEYWEEDERSET